MKVRTLASGASVVVAATVAGYMLGVRHTVAAFIRFINRDFPGGMRTFQGTLRTQRLARQKTNCPVHGGLCSGDDCCCADKHLNVVSDAPA